MLGNDDVALVESLEDFGPVVASEADGDRGEYGAAVLYFEDIPVIGAPEHGSVGDGECVLADGGDDPGVEAGSGRSWSCELSNWAMTRTRCCSIPSAEILLNPDG